MTPGTPRQSGCVDVHEDAVDAGATPAPATTRLALAQVTDCDDCPLSRAGKMEVTCVLVPHAVVYRYSAEPVAKLPPPWCPLRRGVAVLELKAGA